MRARTAVRRPGAVLAASALLLAIAGCAAGDEFADPPPGLDVTVFQHRLDYVPRVLEVRLENGGDASLEVTEVAFRSSRFADAARDPDGVTLTPGRAVALRIPLPESVCDVRDDGGPVVDVSWVDADGAHTTRIPAVDEQAVLDRINDEDCLAAAVAEVARITPPAALRTEGAGTDVRAWIDLSVEPAGGDGTLRLRDVRTTTLLVGPGGVGWPLEVAVGDRSGGFDVVSGDDLRADVYAFVGERCALPAR
ncbi:hypothetical protein [Agromyces sp. SYSU T00194]|uniref:hypothetical protein n=1 Tax=Agromyces chitinivorans TaxID=3158560 RepID=UPI003391C2BF